MAWGDLFKIFDWIIPSRKESIASKIDRLERKLNDISERQPYTDSDSREYDKLSKQLREAILAAKNN